MTRRAFLILQGLLLLLPIGLLAWMWPSLPGGIAVGWDIDGEPDRFIDRNLALGTAYGLTLLLSWMLALLDRHDAAAPDADPVVERRHRSAVRGLRLLVTGVGVLTTVVVLGHAAQWKADALLHLGTLAVVGVIAMAAPCMAALRPNPWFGVRTRRTLASAELWWETHQFARVTWLLGCVLLLGFRVLLNHQQFIQLLIVVGLLLIALPLVYAGVRRMPEADHEAGADRQAGSEDGHDAAAHDPAAPAEPSDRDPQTGPDQR